jgi:hypothetical protein
MHAALAADALHGGRRLIKVHFIFAQADALGAAKPRFNPKRVSARSWSVA